MAIGLSLVYSAFFQPTFCLKWQSKLFIDANAFFKNYVNDNNKSQFCSCRIWGKDAQKKAKVAKVSAFLSFPFLKLPRSWQIIFLCREGFVSDPGSLRKKFVIFHTNMFCYGWERNVAYFTQISSTNLLEYILCRQPRFFLLHIILRYMLDMC